MRYDKDVLFYIENEVQFESLKPLLVYIRDKTELDFDIVVPDFTTLESDGQNKDIYDGGARVLTSNGFDVVRSVNDTELPTAITTRSYKVMMSAYMYRWHYDNVNANYFLMFPYTALYLNKPNWTINRFIELDYIADGLFSYAPGMEPVLSIFTRTHTVPSLKLMDYKHRKTSGKPVLFFAPTYNQIEFAASILEGIEELKQHYTVVMRGHHRIDHLSTHKSFATRLYESADKVYDLDEYSLVESMATADIVVSDDSGVLFDAIYCGIPIAIFSEDPSRFRYKEVKTAQEKWIDQGDVLWTDDPLGIISMVNDTLKKNILERQRVMQKTLFPMERERAVEQWFDILSIYLNDELPVEYRQVKRYWVDRINGDADKVNLLERDLQDKNRALEKELHPGIKTSLRRLANALRRRMSQR